MEIGQRAPSFALLALAIAFVTAHPLLVDDVSGVDAIVAATIALVCAAVCGAALHGFAGARPRS